MAMNNNSIYAHRNLSIDMLRALTMFIMIFVNDFWKIHDVPHWLEHAKYGEDFMGLADVVFPCFLFAVGMSIPYAISRRYDKGYSTASTLKHVLSRTFALLIMGAFISNSEFRLSDEAPYTIGVYWFIMAFGFISVWNQYPKPKTDRQKHLFTLFQGVGVILLLYIAFTFRNPNDGVFGPYWGILGAIGFAYLFCALVYVMFRDRLRMFIYICMALTLICILLTPLRAEYGGTAIWNLPEQNFVNGFLGLLHIGNGALPAFTMGGMIISIISVRYISKSIGWRCSSGILLGALFLILGIIAHRFWIVAKIEATPTWLFYVLSISIFTYTLLTCLEHYHHTRWFTLIKPAGTATLTTYLVPYVYYGFADTTNVVLPDFLTHGFIGIINSLCFAFLVIATTWALGKIDIKLKI